MLAHSTLASPYESSLGLGFRVYGFRGFRLRGGGGELGQGFWGFIALHSNELGSKLASIQAST